MRRRTTALIVGASIGALVGAAMTTVFAQQPGQNQRRPKMPTMLGDDDPNIGDALPDISLYDDKGDTIRLRSLKGKYKVIVFGCLT